MEPVNLREFERAARAVLDPVHYDYIAGGAQDEHTLRANERSFAELCLLPRILRGSGAPDLGTDLLGRRLPVPVLLAPTAFHRLVHHGAEPATARAAATAGVTMIAAMLSTVAVEEIAAAARKAAPDPELWFQLYLQPDLDFTAALVGRAEAAGCRALVVTVDSPDGPSDRNRRPGESPGSVRRAAR